MRMAGLVLLAILVILVMPSIVASNKNYVILVLGDHRCPHCRGLDSFLRDNGFSHVFCDMASNRSCIETYLKLTEELGIPQVVPISIVIAGDEPVAVVRGGVKDKSFWSQLVSMSPGEKVAYYVGSRFNGYFNITPARLAALLNISSPISSETRQEDVGPRLLATLLLLAASDSVNPCTIYLYTLLLIASSMATRDPRRVASVGASFSLAVYAGYYMLGLGLLRVSRLMPSWIFPLVAIGFGVWTLAAGLAGESRIAEKTLVFSLLRRARFSALFAGILGFTATFTLLPCSAGPYLVFAGILSDIRGVLPYFLLALYNLVFIAPLIAVLFLVERGLRASRIRDFIVRNNALLSSIAGALLIGIGIYMLVYL